MFLCIDRGNSRTKTGIFNDAGELLHSDAYRNFSAHQIKELADRFEIVHGIISSTSKEVFDIAELNLQGKSITLHHTTPLPIDILYKTPETLGRDRIASACGAHHLYPGKNCLVVDAGTCITMDMVLGKGIFIGGNIAPGITMRLEAMHEKTGRLPMVEPGYPELKFGDSTLHALQNGACLGAAMEIEGILNHAKKAYSEVSVVITGGDATLLAANVECQIFVEPELVIQGLFQILLFNVSI